MRFATPYSPPVRVSASSPNAPLLVHLGKASTAMERFLTQVQSEIVQAHASQGRAGPESKWNRLITQLLGNSGGCRYKEHIKDLNMLGGTNYYQAICCVCFLRLSSAGACYVKSHLYQVFILSIAQFHEMVFVNSI